MDTPHIIVGGDCNAKSPWWGHDVEDRRGESYANYLAQRDLEVLNEGKEPTFFTIRRNIVYQSMVDVTVCTQSLVNRVKNWKVHTDLVTTSDHRAITFEITKDRHENSSSARQSTRLYNTKKADWKKFGGKLVKLLADARVTPDIISSCTSPEELDDLVNQFTGCVKKACEEVIPQIGPFVTKRLKWWNSELDRMKAEVNRKRRKIKKANPRRKQYIVEEYKTSLEEYKAAIVNARTSSWKKFCSSQERESVWDKIYRIMKCSGKMPEEIMLRHNGRSLDASESAVLLASTFYPKDDPDEDEPYHREVRNLIKNLTLQEGPDYTPVELDEIWHVLAAISPRKAPGEDGLTADICFEAFKMEPLVVQTILNKCLGIGHFPRAWKRAVIKVLKKPAKEDYSEPKSYRPIGLLPIYGKVLEKIVCSRLLWSLGRASNLNSRQYGFVPQKSTEDALFDAVTKIRAGMDRKDLVAVVSLDIEGAFDNAWWPGIQKQLLEKDCEPYIIRLLRSYMEDRYITLRYAGSEATRQTTKGCIQGSTGGPLMWNLQLDPLLKKAEGLKAHLQAFADDILVIAAARTTDDLEDQVNEALRMISQWGREYKMKFAAHKTQALLVTRRLKYNLPKLILNGTTLEFSTTLTLLGVTIDAGLTFRQHLEKTTNKALKIYKSVSKTARATWGLNADIVRLIYMAVIEPTILYAASVWAPIVGRKYARKKLDRTTRMFALKICKAHRTVSLNAGMVLGSILPLDLRAQENSKLYQYKRGEQIRELPGRTLESDVSPYSLPHPARRNRIPYGSLLTEEDIKEITQDEPQLYTDGSKIEGKVGAAVSYWVNGCELANTTIKLADYCSVYQAELVAINKALDVIEKKKHKNGNHFQIISDSKSALQKIEDGHSRNPITAEIRAKLEKLKNVNTQVSFFWIKAHEGLAGNERADELAKKAALAKKTAPAYDAVPVAFAKWLIRDETLKVLQIRYEEEETGKTTKKFFPDVRKAHKTLKKIKNDNKICQLFTGHGGFGEYLYRFKLKPSPACDCDGDTPETVLHIICECPKFSTKRTDVEIRTGVSITQQNLAGLLESDTDREIFLNFALEIVNNVNKRNNSKIVLLGADSAERSNH